MTVYLFPSQFIPYSQVQFPSIRKVYKEKNPHSMRVTTIYPDKHRQVLNVGCDFSAPEAQRILGQA